MTNTRGSNFGPGDGREDGPSLERAFPNAPFPRGTEETDVLDLAFAWRWLFWFADAAWSREVFVEMMRRESEGGGNNLNAHQ